MSTFIGPILAAALMAQFQGGTLQGTVVDDQGKPVADAQVIFHAPAPRAGKVESVEVRVKTADGSFQTPDNLLVGSPYRVVVLAPGMEAILSDWITIGEKPRILLPMLQRPLRSVSGRVVDRQGKPVANIEDFQSGDGPERTNTKTDADGRFTLGGFCQGPVFLFARGEGFRFFGRLIKPGDEDAAVELTRTSERPARGMRMLPDPIPPEESRALAQRLIEPYWAAFEHKNEVDKIRILRSLTTVDPVGVLRKLEEMEFADARSMAVIQGQVARALAQTDPIQAEALAKSIEVPDLRAMALVAVADGLPDGARDRKLALLDRAALQAKATTSLQIRLSIVGEVAERWYELGEKEKAKALFAEGLQLANQVPNKTAQQRGRFAARLVRVDLPSALAIAREFSASGTNSANGVLQNIAFHLAADNPAGAERVLRQIPQETGRDWLPPRLPGRWPRWIPRAPRSWSKNCNGISTTRRRICYLPSA